MIKRNNSRQFFWFLIIGATSAVINFSSFYLLWKIGIDYKLATTIAFIFAVIIHFFGNRHLTFQNLQPIRHQLKKYMMLLVINYLITLGAVTTGVDALHLPPYVAQIFAILLTVGISYLISSQFVFKMELNR